MHRLIVCFVITITIVTSTTGQIDLKNDTKWSHKVKLDEGVDIRWRNFFEGDEWWVHMEYEVYLENVGYLGVGFSPNGAMTGSDLYIGWIDEDGNAKLKDFHATSNALPIQDHSQNVELLGFTRSDGCTRMQFKRKWNTCDDNDIEITNDTMRLIWAYSDVPMKPEYVMNTFSANYHGPSTRGAKSVIIADGGSYPPFPDVAPQLYNNVKSWDMVMDGARIEAINTTYYCKILKFEDSEKKNHLIGWKPILQQENWKLVHHIVIFECQVPRGEVTLFDNHAKTHGGQCYTQNMPMEWSNNCVQFLFVWVVGSEGEMFPNHVGIPLGDQHGGTTYFMVEMHYENPGLRKAIDHSGVRLFYTDNLRKYDGGALLMGYRHSPFLFIPPKQEEFRIHGICGKECTSRMIPPSGIHITNTLVHMHLWGKKIRLRHFRNGVELPIVAEDNYYDFNYQQSRTLQKEVTILPGDDFSVECDYNTIAANKYVLGGLATMQEMCQVFFIYYPRIYLTQCTSQYEFNSFFNGFGIEGVESDVLKRLKMPYDPKLLDENEAKMDLADDARELEGFQEGISYKSVFDIINVTSPKRYRGKSAGDRMMSIAWNAESGKDLENFWKNGKHYAFCTRPARIREPLEDHIINYPKVTSPLNREDATCRHVTMKAGSSNNVDIRTNIAICAIMSTMTIILQM